MMPAQNRHRSTNKHFRGDQTQCRQLHFCRCSSTNESRGFLGLLPFHSLAHQGSGHWGQGIAEQCQAPSAGLVPHSPCSRLSSLAAGPAHPEVSQPPHQQLLVHFPSSQAHFLSLVHRDYSSSKTGRKEPHRMLGGQSCTKDKGVDQH